MGGQVAIKKFFLKTEAQIVLVEMKHKPFPYWIHVFFGLVWIGTGTVFIQQMIDARQQENTKLDRYDPRIPASFNVQIGNIRFQDIINGLADSYNKNMAKLEEQIHSSAKLSFEMNGVSAFMCALGLFAQVGQYKRERNEHNKAHREKKPC